jgi:serine/threonine protein kinase
MDHKEEFERKLLNLTQITQHQNLANFLGISLNNSEIYVIYEQFTGSSLFGWLDSNKDFVLSWIQKAKIALGYASALQHLHSCNFSFFNEPLKPLR